MVVCSRTIAHTHPGFLSGICNNNWQITTKFLVFTACSYITSICRIFSKIIIQITVGKKAKYFLFWSFHSSGYERYTFLDMALQSLVEKYWSFRGTCCPMIEAVSSLEMSVHFFVYTVIFNLVFIIIGNLIVHLSLLCYSEMLVDIVLNSGMHHISPGSW